MFPAGLDVPPARQDVLPLAPPRRLSAAVGSLQLAGLDHPKAPAGLWAEGGDEVPRLGHQVHALTVDRASVGGYAPAGTPERFRTERR